jgi:uncharacterized repeat protein (TIGR03803 family)
VTNARQQAGLKMRRGAGSAMLAFVLIFGLGVVTTQSAEAQTFTVLYNFARQPDGRYPFASLIRDVAGNLYGTTWEGGSLYEGAVFKLSKSGKETVLHSFSAYPSDGAAVSAGLVRDAAGNLYGTTVSGGSDHGKFDNGTVFKLSKSGKETLLHIFLGSPDGKAPYGTLVRDADGNLYGTTAEGGVTGGACGAYGCGTVFKVDKNGIETVLYRFTGGDGEHPIAGLVTDAKGNLYGTSEWGGSGTACEYGCGTVFELSKTGEETVLYSFTGQPDGANPLAGLIMDSKGNLYGATFYGGNSACPYGCGTVFELSNKGQESVLYSFCAASGCSDGAYPSGSVIMGAKGNLYGTTYEGGNSACDGGCGTVFELSDTGKETVLHSFRGAADGKYPFDGLIWDRKGSLYGTARGGGASDYGTVWKLTP